MTGKFQYVRELEDGGNEDIIRAVRRLIGQSNVSETTAVLQNQIDVPELSGDNTQDIQMLHEVVNQLAKTIRGEQ